MTSSPSQLGREEEAAWLADQAKNLEEELLQVQKRLTELKKNKEANK